MFNIILIHYDRILNYFFFYKNSIFIQYVYTYISYETENNKLTYILIV